MSKKTNRILSVILTICLSVSLFAYTASADEATAVDEGYLAARQFLSDLGILRFDIADPNAAMNRAQFVDMAMRTYIEDLSEVEAAHSFTDVIPNYEYKDAIEAAYGSGIIRGDGNGRFGIDENITTTAAITVMLRILGYEQQLEWMGGFEANYLTMSSRLGLTSGIDLSREYISSGDAVKLVYNATDIALFEFSGVEDGTLSYTKNADGTLLTERLKIYDLEGVLTDNSTASLMGVAPQENGFVKVDGTVYSAGATNAADFIGYNVKIYYKRLNDSSVPTILHIEDNDSDVTYIDEDTYAGYSNNTLHYYRGKGSKSSVRVGANALILYNNALVKGGQYSDELFDITNGSITVIEKSVEGMTVVNIKSYVDVIVDRVAETLDYTLIVDKFDPSRNVYIKDGNMFTARDASGANIDIKSIAPDSTVSAAVSLDGDCGELVVSTESVKQAYVTSAGSDSVMVKVFDESIHTYAEPEYEYTADFKERNKKDNIVKPGHEYTVYINSHGYAAHLEPEKDPSDFYAYIIGDDYDDKGLVSEITLKVFKSDGKVAQYEVKDSVKIDGVSCKNKSKDEVRTLLGLDSDTKSRLVYISLDYDSNIREVDTCPDATPEREADYKLYKSDREAEDTIYKLDPGTDIQRGLATPTEQFVSVNDGYLSYSSAGTAFNTGVFLDTATKIFAVPTDTNDETRYKMITTASFMSNTYYKVEAYSRDDYSISPEAVVCFYTSRYNPDPDKGFKISGRLKALYPFAKTSDTDTAFVKSLSTGTDPNTGEIVDIIELTVLRTGSTATHYIDDHSLVEGLTQGDLVRWYTFGGAMCYLEKMYSLNDKEFNLEVNENEQKSGAYPSHGRTLVWTDSTATQTHFASYFGWPDPNAEETLGAKVEYITDNWQARDNDKRPRYIMAHGVIANINLNRLAFVTYDDYAAGRVDEENQYIGSCASTKYYKYDYRENALVPASRDDAIIYRDGELNSTEVIIIMKGYNIQSVIVL